MRSFSPEPINRLLVSIPCLSNTLIEGSRLDAMLQLHRARTTVHTHSILLNFDFAPRSVYTLRYNWSDT